MTILLFILNLPIFQVIKPSVVGGFENAALIAQWAQQLGKMAVISAAFESSLSLSTYVQFSCYLDIQNASRFTLSNNKVVPSVAHGLGTYRWLKEDITSNPVLIGRNPHSNFVEASVADARKLLKNFQLDQNVINYVRTEEQVHRYQLTVELDNLSCVFHVQEVGQKNVSKACQ